MGPRVYSGDTALRRIGCSSICSYRSAPNRVSERVVVDREAKKIQLSVEYDPAPPFDAGSPESAEAELVEGVSELGRELFENRWRQVERVATRLQETSAMNEPAG